MITLEKELFVTSVIYYKSKKKNNKLTDFECIIFADGGRRLHGVLFAVVGNSLNA